MRYGKPCALIAVNETIVADGPLISKDMPRVSYAGNFDIEMIPSIRLATKRRRDVSFYQNALGPKAMVIHPYGLLYTAVDRPSLNDAAYSALAQCTQDPRTHNGLDGPCYIYALNNDVVLTKRMIAPP